MNKKESKKMNTWMKIILALAGVGCIGLVAFGIATMQTVKEDEIRDKTILIQATDSTKDKDKTEAEKIVEQNIEEIYGKEAEALWQQHFEELICSNEQFVDKYIQYRNNGLTSEQAWNSLFNEYAKENQIQFNEAGEVVAEAKELEAIMNSQDENIDEPVVENTEVTENVEPENVEESADFVVEEITPCQLYAVSSVNVRKGPDADDFDKIGDLKQNQRVTVTGIVKQYKEKACLWYRLEGTQGNIGYVSGAYLAENPVSVNNNENQQTENSSSQNTNSDVMDKLNELLKNSTPLNGAAGGQAIADAGGAAAGVTLE